MSCKYKRAKAEMTLNGLSIRDVAQKMNIQYEALTRRLRGVIDFSLDDAIAFKKAINSSTPLEKLFEVSE